MCTYLSRFIEFDADVILKIIVLFYFVYNGTFGQYKLTLVTVSYTHLDVYKRQIFIT